jgi:hypothetical protein
MVLMNTRKLTVVQMSNGDIIKEMGGPGTTLDDLLCVLETSVHSRTYQSLIISVFLRLRNLVSFAVITRRIITSRFFPFVCVS